MCKLELLCLVDSLSMDIVTFFTFSAKDLQLDSLFDVLEFISFIFFFLPTYVLIQPKSEDVDVSRDDLSRALMVCDFALFLFR